MSDTTGNSTTLAPFEEAHRRLENEACKSLVKLTGQLRDIFSDPEPKVTDHLLEIPDPLYDFIQESPGFRNKVVITLDEELGVPARSWKVEANCSDHEPVFYFRISLLKSFASL